MPLSSSQSDYSQSSHWRNCCLLRLSALGDVSHALALLRALQFGFPDAQFSWIIGPREYELLQGIQGVNFIVFDKRGGRKSWQHLKSRLAGQRFDLLLHLQTSLRANLLSRLVHARRRIGWDSSRAREGHRWFISESITESAPQHQTQGFLAFARHLGCTTTEPNWDIPIPAHARQQACDILPGLQDTLLISPCSSHPQRDWHLSGYQQIARHAITTLGMRVLLCGGPSERERSYGEQIAQVHPNIINWVGRDTLPLLLALLERASLVLSPDSGPAHLANAVGTPVIALHAATWSRRSGPYHSLNLCVDRFTQAAERFRRRAPETLRWGTRIEVPGVMDLITVADVIQQLESSYQKIKQASTS